MLRLQFLWESWLGGGEGYLARPLCQAFPFNILKKTQDEKDENSRKILNNSSKNLKVSANFVLFYEKQQYSDLLEIESILKFAYPIGKTSLFSLKEDIFWSKFWVFFLET